MANGELYPRLITIIIPVYNTPENFLQRSIKSVLIQDYNNLEIIIIDDGSGEEIANVCDEIAQLDSRIKVIHQNHAGVSAARNHGIDNASGEYLMFVDADDELLPNILADAVAKMEDNDLDILYGTVIDRRTQGDRTRKLGFPKNETLRIYNDKTQISVIQEYFLAYETPNSSIAPKGLGTGPCYKLYKRAVISSLRFDENLSILEDAVFNSEVAANALKIGLQDNPWYIYHHNAFSTLETLNIDNGADIHSTALLQHASNEHLLNACYMNICTYLFFAIRATSERKEPHLLRMIQEAINRPCFIYALLNVDWKRYDLKYSTKLKYMLAQKGDAFLLMLYYKARENKILKKIR